MPWLDPVPGGWRVGWREGGRGARKVYGDVIKSKARATAELARIKAALAAKAPLRRLSTIPLDEVIARWSLSRDAEGNDPVWTKAAAARMARAVERAGWQDVRDITAATVTAWRQAGGSARLGAYLRGLLRWAAEVLEQPVDARALVALRPPRRHAAPPGRLLTDEEVDAARVAADAISPNVGALVWCLSTYGWRPVSAARMQVGDLLDGAVRLRVKGRRIIEHPVGEEGARRLREAAGTRKRGAVFLRPVSRLPWPLNGPHAFSLWCRLSLGIAAYDLKRYAISGMLARGMAPHEVAAFTGHLTVAQVLSYSRTSAASALASLPLVEGHRGAPAATACSKAAAQAAESARKATE